jgi:ubiquinone/menaquinone biosynthesis C-methylase UbiE
VLDLLGDLSGKDVADIGAGSGYFTFKIAKLAKKVIALDIDPYSLEYISDQKSIVGKWAENIETRLTPADVPNLIENEVDVVLIVNTFAFIPDTDKYLLRLRKGMKSGARLVIIDFKKGDVPVGPSDDAKVSAEEVVRILSLAGFSKTKIDLESLQYQYIVTTKN